MQPEAPPGKKIWTTDIADITDKKKRFGRARPRLLLVFIRDIRDILGSILSLGSWGSNQNNSGLTLSYQDSTSSSSAVVSFGTLRPATTWRWLQYNSLTSSGAPQMELDAGNRLTLYDATGNAAVVIDPAGTTTVFHIPPQGDISMGTFTHSP